MPTLPRTVDLVPDGINVLNAIRNSASADYQSRVPIATQDNIFDVGVSINEFHATQNEFLNALVNRIARVIIVSKLYSNPLKRFKKGMLEYGETIEEIFVNIARAHEFNPDTAENQVFKREIPDVATAFHKLNYKNFYKATISDEMLRQAFVSAQGVTDLIARIVDSMYSGAEFDEYLVMKQLIVEAAEAGNMWPVTIPAVTAENAKSIVTTIKGISNKLEFMSSQYNAQGVVTFTKKPNQIILMDAAFDATIDVNVLASAFNMEKAEFMGQRVLVDDFGTLTGAVAALVDADFFMVFDTLAKFTEIYNSEGLYWNYFYHVWKVFSTSPFANAILFTTDTISVTGVTVTPATATVKKGATAQFSASVAGNLVPQRVVWTTNSTVSLIDHDGTLQVSPDETAATITVTATSVYDGTKKGTATVTVSSN